MKLTLQHLVDILPAGTPDWITPELVEQTIRVWQPYYQQELTIEGALEIIQTVGRFVDALSPPSQPSQHVA